MHPLSTAHDWPGQWRQPGFEPYRAAGERHFARVASGVPWLAALNAAAPVAGRQFCDQAELPTTEAYESFVFASGRCPTRENLHDFFNALVWHQFPSFKARLNQWHAQTIAEHGQRGPRGTLRDAITLLDEQGALLLTSDEVWMALQAHDWHRALVTLRAHWRQSQLIIFGHALLEKLLTPRKALTAHVIRVPDAFTDLSALDALLTTTVTAQLLATKPFTPLPVLGVPGWWPENESASFYADASVFRPRRPPAASTVSA